MKKEIIIASWNVNSVNIRMPHILEIIKKYKIDVIGLQETKTPDANFPINAVNTFGYRCIYNGQKTFNGTGFITKEEIKLSKHNLKSMELDYQRRFLEIDYKGIKIINCYIPNGKEVGDEKYFYKLKWLTALYKYLKKTIKTNKNIVLMGDFNIAADDRDVYDPDAWKDKILCSQQERDMLDKIKSLGFKDSFRMFNQEAGHYSWWDYRNGDFQLNNGMRIDYIFISKELSKKCTSSVIEKEPRSWERPSDHTPVIVKIDLSE